MRGLVLYDVFRPLPAARGEGYSYSDLCIPLPGNREGVARRTLRVEAAFGRTLPAARSCFFSGGQDSSVCLAWALERYSPASRRWGLTTASGIRSSWRSGRSFATRSNAGFPGVGRAAGRRPLARHQGFRRDRRDCDDRRQGDRDHREGPALHLRAGPQPGVPDLCGGARRPAGAEGAGGRHVRDRLLRLSGLPAQDHGRHGDGAGDGHRAALPDRHAADAPDQGRDLGAGQGPGRRGPGGADPPRQPHLLSRSARAGARLGRGLRAPVRLASFAPTAGTIGWARAGQRWLHDLLR